MQSGLKASGNADEMRLARIDTLIVVNGPNLTFGTSLGAAGKLSFLRPAAFRNRYLAWACIIHIRPKSSSRADAAQALERTVFHNVQRGRYVPTQ